MQPNKVLNRAIRDEVVARQLLLDDHRRKSLNADILQKKSEILRGRLNELRDAYKLTSRDFWPCGIYADMDKMIQKCITDEEPERGKPEKVQRGGPIVEVKERLQRQSNIAKELIARENAYRGMTTEQLVTDITRLERLLVNLRNRIQEDEDRLHQLKMDYENSLNLSPIFRYFRLRSIILNVTR